MEVLKSIYNNVKIHLPVYLGAVLLVVNILIGDGAITLPNTAVDVINALLVSAGLGTLHVQSRRASK